MPISRRGVLGDRTLCVQSPRTPRRVLSFAPLRIAFQLFKVGLQLITLTPRRFEVEEKVLDIELKLVDRILGDADEAALQARKMTQLIAERHHLFTEVQRH